MNQPTKDDFREFLDVFRRLSSFEAQQRTIRGYGAFRAEECPMPAVVKTLAWLEAIESGLPGAIG